MVRVLGDPRASGNALSDDSASGNALSDDSSVHVQGVDLSGPYQNGNLFDPLHLSVDFSIL